LLIAKLDRLARNVHFISGLMETGVPFVAADMPTAIPFMLHIYAVMAEAEGIAISTRTKAALAAAKARGVKLGNPRLLAGSPGQARMAAAAKSAKATARATDLLPVIAEVRAAGVATLSGSAKALTARGVPTPSGRGAWSPATVLRLDRRVQAA
jgi:DNA invertase Pin-like site-specific DNA recombinase